MHYYEDDIDDLFDNEEYDYDEYDHDFDSVDNQWEYYYHSIAEDIDEQSPTLIKVIMNTLNQEIEQFRIAPDGNVIQGASHTCRVLNHKVRNRYVIQTFSDIRKLQIDFDTIACSGTSGLMVVPQVAELLEKNICVVRTTDKCYSDFQVEGVSPTRYIIIDDLVCSGYTVKKIMSAMKEHAPRSFCMGVYCYIREECAYRNEPRLFRQDFCVPYLNPCPERGQGWPGGPGSS